MHDDDFLDDYDGIFDDDDALDYIIYEDVINDSTPSPRGNNHGCLGMVVVLLTPLTGLFWLLRVHG